MFTNHFSALMLATTIPPEELTSEMSTVLLGWNVSQHFFLKKYSFDIYVKHSC